VPAITAPPLTAPALRPMPEPFAAPSGISDDWNSWWTPPPRMNGHPAPDGHPPVPVTDYAPPPRPVRYTDPGPYPDPGPYADRGPFPGGYQPGGGYPDGGRYADPAGFTGNPPPPRRPVDPAPPASFPAPRRDAGSWPEPEFRARPEVPPAPSTAGSAPAGPPPYAYPEALDDRTAEFPATDLPVADLPVADLPVADVQPSGAPPPDELPPAAPWRQEQVGSAAGPDDRPAAGAASPARPEPAGSGRSPELGRPTETEAAGGTPPGTAPAAPAMPAELTPDDLGPDDLGPDDLGPTGTGVATTEPAGVAGDGAAQPVEPEDLAALIAEPSAGGAASHVAGAGESADPAVAAGPPTGGAPTVAAARATATATDAPTGGATTGGAEDDAAQTGPRLNRRVPLANLAEGLRRGQDPAASPPQLIRDPEQAREALSRFQASQRAARAMLDGISRQNDDSGGDRHD
jgi:hypothetical protein